jgi:DNA-binding transcriptional regulator YdaS (Cro superfamily)
MRTMRETPVDALIAAAEIAGGLSALAAALTKMNQEPVSPARVWNWVNRDGGALVEYCAQIEEIVGKKVTRQRLRPDDWQGIWPELSKTGKQPA